MWDVIKGITKTSLFGQLALVFADKGSMGAEINLVVKGQGKETQYTVLEALTLMTEEKK